MTPAQWRRVRDVFEALVDVDVAEGRRRLEAEVADDPAVRAEAASLLEHHSRAGAFLLEAPPVEALESDDLEPDDVLGPYVVVREIGQGGMGRVYLAQDTRLQRRVCLKAVRSDLVDAPQFRERLQREAQLAASLSHPGICAVYALEEFDGHLYLVTEFIEGRTLREEIAGGDLPTPREVLGTMRDLTRALGAAHAKGIAHRDLKPENVIRALGGQLKILDFGLARIDEESTTTSTATLPGMLIGTPAYMAPEQVNGGRTDRRTDFFALGVLIYEYATGVHPFTGGTPFATAARILEHVPESLDRRRPDLPFALVNAVERCLRKNPGERFATTDELIAMLENEPPGTARPPDHPRIWWRLHQLTVVPCYFLACVVAWVLQQWEPTLGGRWAFVLIGVLAAVNGVIRGHLLFTDRFHPDRLSIESRRTRLPLLGFDLALATILAGAASVLAASHTVTAVLAMGLAAGLGTAAVFIEPATSAVALDSR